MKMKIHKLQIVLMMVFMCSLPALGVQAREGDGTGTENMQLTDQAGLFTEEEASEIERQIAALEEKTGWDIMAVTTDDAGGKGATDYMETWFDDYTGKDDGIICGIDMDNREIVIRAFGECRFYITDNRTDKVLDAGYEGVSDEKYGEGMKGMLREVETAYREENPENNRLYDEDTGEVTNYRKDRWKITKMELLIAAIAALAAGAITAMAVIGKYRLQFGGYKYSIEKNGSVRLRKEEDHFVNQFVTHRHIERDDPDDGDGGISTIHTGAGGRSSSGGSRKF